MATFSSEQLNFFTFSTVVLDEFPVALRKVFVHMWDTLVASKHGGQKWDNSGTVLNLFLSNEGGAAKVPTLNKFIEEWDCTALFKATLFALTFAMPDASGGVATLHTLYVKPHSLPSGTFHPSVLSPYGNQAETFALALDQLRLLRNTLCHQIGTKKIDKTTLDHYLLLAKQAFVALGQDTFKIDGIGNLGEEDFPTARAQQLEEELKIERAAAVKFEQIEHHLDQIKFEVKGVGTDVKDVKTDLANVGSDVKEMKTGLANVGLEVKGMKADVQDIKQAIQTENPVKAAQLRLRFECEIVPGGEPQRGAADMLLASQAPQLSLQSPPQVPTTSGQPQGPERLAASLATAVSSQSDVITPQQVLNRIADMYIQIVNPSSREELSEFLIYMKEFKNVLVVDKDLGSLIITVECSSLEILHELWEDYCSGHLNEVAQKLLVTEDILKEFNLLEVKLTTTILEEEFKVCRDYFLQFQDEVSISLEDVNKRMEEIEGRMDGIVKMIEDLTAELNQDESSKEPLVPESCIPTAIPYFVGRQKEYEEILDHLTAGHTRVIEMFGPPGYGKTSLAVNVAHRLQNMKIPVYFVYLPGMESKEDLVSKLLSIFAGARQVPQSGFRPTDWLIRRLQQLPNPSILMFDGADVLHGFGGSKRVKEEVFRFIAKILTLCSHIKVLFTSRAHLGFLYDIFPIGMNEISTIEVKEVDQVSSVSLVNHLLPDASEDDCNAIAMKGGCVPAAILLLCSVVRDKPTDITYSKFLETLERDIPFDVIMNKSFERLTHDERDTIVSFAVFPGFFGIEEAAAVLDSKIRVRVFNQKSLEGGSDLIFNIGSPMQSFIKEKAKTDPEIGAVLEAAQRRFYSYYISIFEVANETFLTGGSVDAVKAFNGHRKSILLSLRKGTRDEELYPKAVEVLSKAEVFLYIVVDDELLCDKLYNSAIEEAKRRHSLVDEKRLLAAKSFGVWGSFPLRQTSEINPQEGYVSAADCPAKLLCHAGIYLLLSGKLDEGVSSLRVALDRLSDGWDERILKVLTCHALAVSYKKKKNEEKAAYFENFRNNEFTAKAKQDLVFMMLVSRFCESFFRNFDL